MPGYDTVTAPEFFEKVHSIWFEQIEEKMGNLTKTTFLKGGYYVYPVDDKLSIIGLNTILFNSNLNYKAKTVDANA